MQFAKDGDEAEGVLGDLSYDNMEDVGRIDEFWLNVSLFWELLVLSDWQKFILYSEL